MDSKSRLKQAMGQRGQSLVEVALVMPFLIVLIAGIVEVSNLVITQNRVSNAARIATRFAANGGVDEGLSVVALNAVTQTLELGSDRWDMWSIRAETNDSGTGFTSWTINHIFGISNTASFTSVNWTEIQQETLSELQTNSSGQGGDTAIAANLKVVGTLILYDTESILGLDTLSDLIRSSRTIRGLTVMRQTNLAGVNPTEGCDGFPVAVNKDIISLSPSTYPPANEFTYPSPAPAYTDFPSNVPGIPLVNAKEGYIFLAQNGFGSGNFGWLVWNDGISSSANTLADSLTWPGNSTDYQDHNDGGQPASPQNWPWVVRGFVEAGDSNDIAMHIGDWVAGSTGSINASAVRTQAETHIDLGRTLRLLVWDQSDGTGSGGRYHISGFALFKLLGYKLNQGGSNPSWILVEFVRWDTSCGQLSG